MGIIELLLIFMMLATVNGGDTIAAGDSLPDNNQTILSAGEAFALGFFTPPGSNFRYLGICYNNIRPQTVVWFANSSRPLNGFSGILNLTTKGNLILFDRNNGENLWSSQKSDLKEPIVQLLHSGNLVLKDQTEIKWQSFYELCDTLLPGMRLGVDLQRNSSNILRSWKNSSYPLNGDYTYKVDPRGGGNGVPEVYLREGDKIVYRSGPWNGRGYSGRPEMNSNPDFIFNFTVNQDNVYYTFQSVNNSILSRIVLADGKISRYNWIDSENIWNQYWSKPSDKCDYYNTCGPNAVCTYDITFTCNCLDNEYSPISDAEWKSKIYKSGCARNATWNCSVVNGFLEKKYIKLPETTYAIIVDKSFTPGNCQDWCARNCSCKAYALIDQTGCVAWMKDWLLDIKSFNQTGDTIYIKSAFVAPPEPSPPKKFPVIIVVCAVIGSVLLLSLFLLFFWRITRKRKGNANATETQQRQSSTINTGDEHPPANQNNANPALDSGRKLGVPMFDIASVKAATNDFAVGNILGEGGFGVVYKGELQNGQVIAVKRLVKLSLQGPEAFKNEVKLIAKLQHTNLISLLGCCISEEERIVILEYMENGSLDNYIFDKTKGMLLDWRRRHTIITSVAQGLLYLHRDSKSKVIHRDLKLSNILLDQDLNPKISDFGIAKFVEGEKCDIKATSRPVGTLAYMAPEYSSSGIFSFKSDVFSFGVILFEIISGRKNSLINLADNSRLNLLAHAYILWREGRSLEILDQTLRSSYPVTQVMRCIRVGLLCVEERSEDRPTMDDVVRYLLSDDMIPNPRERTSAAAERRYLEGEFSSSNEITATLDGR